MELALAKEGFVTTVTLKSNVVEHDFDEKSLQNISEGTRVQSKEAVRQSIDKISQQPVASAQTGYPTASNRESFSISESTYQRIRSAWGGDIRKEFKYLQQTLDRLSKEKNTNTAVAIMIAGGFVTFGTTMWKVYSAYGAVGGLIPLITGAIGALGGIVSTIAIIAAVGAAFAVLWLAMKE